MLQWRQLRTDELEGWYRDKLRRDFPEDERKPFATIEKLMQDGVYHCLLFSDADGRPAAYACLMDSGEFVLLDYLAVEPEGRGKGTGSEALRILVQQLAKGRTVLIEVENPACARSLTDRKTRQDRVRFYQKGGMEMTGVLLDAFGVEYRLLTGGEKRPDGDLAEALRAIYRATLPEPVYNQNIRVSVA